MENYPKVSIGQIWSRKDSTRILVCGLSHPAIASSQRLDEGVAEIRSLSTNPNMLDYPIGPPSYPLMENFPRYYRYHGMREPRRLDLVKRVDGAPSGRSLILVEGLKWQQGLKEVYLHEYFPFRKKKWGKSFEQGWNDKFWQTFMIVGALHEKEYEEIAFCQR